MEKITDLAPSEAWKLPSVPIKANTDHGINSAPQTNQRGVSADADMDLDKTTKRNDKKRKHSK